MTLLSLPSLVWLPQKNQQWWSWEEAASRTRIVYSVSFAVLACRGRKGNARRYATHQSKLRAADLTQAAETTAPVVTTAVAFYPATTGCFTIATQNRSSWSESVCRRSSASLAPGWGWRSGSKKGHRNALEKSEPHVEWEEEGWKASPFRVERSATLYRPRASSILLLCM